MKFESVEEKQKALEATKNSIAHWNRQIFRLYEKDYDAYLANGGSKHCDLCQTYKDCSICPLFKLTGKECSSPYSYFGDTILNYTEPEETIKNAKVMRQQLKRLYHAILHTKVEEEIVVAIGDGVEICDGLYLVASSGYRHYVLTNLFSGTRWNDTEPMGKDAHHINLPKELRNDVSKIIKAKDLKEYIYQKLKKELMK